MADPLDPPASPGWLLPPPLWSDADRRTMLREVIRLLDEACADPAHPGKARP
jgi:hypothetical protein